MRVVIQFNVIFQLHHTSTCVISGNGVTNGVSNNLWNPNTHILQSAFDSFSWVRPGVIRFVMTESEHDVDVCFLFLNETSFTGGQFWHLFVYVEWIKNNKKKTFITSFDDSDLTAWLICKYMQLTGLRLSARQVLPLTNHKSDYATEWTERESRDKSSFKIHISKS